MKLIANLIRRISFWFEMRAIETEINDIDELKNSVRLQELCIGFDIRLEKLSRELVTARGKYQSTFKPGIRKTWTHA